MTLLVCAGDPSADALAALAVAEWLRRDPRRRAEGLGGPALAAAGLRPLEPPPLFGWPYPSPTGIVAPLRALPALWAAGRAIESRARRGDVCGALLVDLPDVNLPLGRRLRRLGVPVVQLVAPQTWAWRPSRNAALRQSCDLLALILPFEEVYFRGIRVEVRYVGHPLGERTPPSPIAAPSHGSIDLALLPGSRPERVDRILPPMLAGVRRLLGDARAAPPGRVVVSAARSLPVGSVERLLDRSGIGTRVAAAVERRPPIEWLHSVHQAWVCAGTGSLEVAWVGVPGCVVFRTDPATWIAARLTVRGGYAGMANRLLDRELMPERIQREFTPERLVEVARLLARPDAFDAARTGAEAIRRILGGPGFAARTADAIDAVATR